MGANWWTFLKKIKIQLPYDTAIGIDPKETTS